jgi:hypothetical protein
MAGQGIVGVGTSGEGCRLVVESSSPLLQRRRQLRSTRACACQLGADGAFDELSKVPPLIPNTQDVLTNLNQFALERYQP